jgi:hypothetical protein
MSKNKRDIKEKSNYESADGFSTSIWGPAVWHFLHTISFNYSVHPTEEDKENYMNFVTALGSVLPCKVCRDHYKENLKAARFSRADFKDRHAFSCFIYKLHNLVNTTHHDRSLDVSYFRLRDNYEIFRAKCIPGKGCMLTPDYVKSRARIEIAPVSEYPDKSSFSIDKKCYEKTRAKKKKKKKN